MVRRTSASLSVSMYSASFPAMKPQRTCPSLGEGEEGTRQDGRRWGWFRAGKSPLCPGNTTIPTVLQPEVTAAL